MKIRQLYISASHNYFGHHGQPAGKAPILEVPEIECVAGRGIRGDRFFDFKENYKGQITFFALENHLALCSQLRLSELSPAGYRRNVIVQGVDLNLFINKEFEIQCVRFRGMTECTPCYWMDQALAPGAEKFLQGRGGLRAIILTNGYLRANE
jgi:MOSC domain-containing protein YiiM